MNILIDGHMLGKGEGGNERYIKNLIFELRKIKSLHLNVFKNNSFPVFQDAVRILYSLPQLAKLNKSDLIHSTYIAPLVKLTKSVVTVHDFSFKRFPEFYSMSERCIFDYLLPISLSQADAIIVPSEFSKKEAIKFYPQYKEKIFVTEEAADSIFGVVDKEKARKYLYKKFKINGPFLLALNSKNPKKNIDRLIDGYRKVQKDFSQLELVIIGEKHNVPGGRVLEMVSDKELNYFYNACEIFIYYSVYEGFGLPILEALKCQALVLPSDIEAHREITKNKLMYADPFDPEDLAAKTKLLLKQKKIAQKLKETGNKIADLYSWKKTAEKTVKAYQFALHR